MAIKPIIEKNWQITFNKSNRSGWVDQLKGMHSYSFILYNNGVLAWDFPERVPQYIKDRVYRELSNMRQAKKGRSHAKTDKQWTPQQIQAHRALMKAAEKMGWNNYQAGLAAHVRKGRKKHTYRYTPTEEHERVIKASSDVLKGRITPEQAMAMLHEYDIFKQRMG